MICKINDEQEALSLLERFQKQGFRTPMLETREQIQCNLLNPMVDPKDLVLGIYRDERLEGLFSLALRRAGLVSAGRGSPSAGRRRMP